MNRIEKKFKLLKKAGKKAFIAFITAGYPDLATTKKLALGLANAGVDILELGVPFSDPLADGPIIQESSYVALKKGVNLYKILDLVKGLRRFTEMPVCLMSYYNPIFSFGEEKFISSAKSSGVDGLIIPDLPPEEGKTLMRLARQSGLDIICFISPTTSACRSNYIARLCRGFIYYVSLTGVTGPRASLPADLIAHLKAVKRITDKPVCVGFGISHPRQVRELSRFCDGVIVGSAIIKKIRENLGRADLIAKVSNFVRSLKS
jgi:tryptophan synthase alpha chain